MREFRKLVHLFENLLTSFSFCAHGRSEVRFRYTTRSWLKQPLSTLDGFQLDFPIQHLKKTNVRVPTDLFVYFCLLVSNCAKHLVKCCFVLLFAVPMPNVVHDKQEGVGTWVHSPCRILSGWCSVQQLDCCAWNSAPRGGSFPLLPFLWRRAVMVVTLQPNRGRRGGWGGVLS